MFLMFISNFENKSETLRNAFVLPRNAIMFNILVLIFLSIINKLVVKTTGNLKILALKVIAAAHERRSLTRGSKYSDLTWELFVFVEERWSLRNRKFDYIQLIVLISRDFYE